jgi:release factor glutamine methyltransferase
VSVRTASFAHLAINWDERVLQPRDWVVLQSSWAAELLDDAPSGPLLELCCGAGHIGLLAADLSGRPLVAVDLSPVACDYARRNADAAGLGDRVEVRCGDLADSLAEGEVFAVVVADPPWIPSAEVGTFPDDPLLAVDGGSDGLDVARAVITSAADHVVPGGSLLVQLGTAEQAATLVAEAAATGWRGGELRTGERGVVQQLLRPTSPGGAPAR